MFLNLSKPWLKLCLQGFQLVWRTCCNICHIFRYYNHIILSFTLNQSPSWCQPWVSTPPAPSGFRKIPGFIWDYSGWRWFTCLGSPKSSLEINFAINSQLSLSYFNAGLCDYTCKKKLGVFGRLHVGGRSSWPLSRWLQPKHHLGTGTCEASMDVKSPENTECIKYICIGGKLNKHSTFVPSSGIAF